MTHINMRLYEPGPIMKRIAQEPGGENIERFLEMIEEPNSVEASIPTFSKTYIIGRMPLSFNALRRHLVRREHRVIDMTATVEFPHGDDVAHAIEILSVAQSADYSENLIRSGVEIALAGRMAETHIHMSLGRPFGDVVQCFGFLSALQDRIVHSITHEHSSNKKPRMRFKLDDSARVSRVIHAHHPEILLSA
jgi:hypothetical protein